MTDQSVTDKPTQQSRQRIGGLVFTILRRDGGALDVDEIADRLGFRRTSVQAACRRLARQDAVIQVGQTVWQVNPKRQSPGERASARAAEAQAEAKVAEAKAVAAEVAAEVAIQPAPLAPSDGLARRSRYGRPPLPEGSVRRAVYDLIRAVDRPMETPEVMERLGLTRKQANDAMYAMAQRDLLVRSPDGRYSLPSTTPQSEPASEPEAPQAAPEPAPQPGATLRQTVAEVGDLIPDPVPVSTVTHEDDVVAAFMDLATGGTVKYLAVRAAAVLEDALREFWRQNGVPSGY